MTEEEKVYPEETYVFFMNGGYINTTTEEEYTAEEVGIYVGISEAEKEKLLQECYNDFLVNNLDAGWYLKE